jgi:endoglucanase
MKCSSTVLFFILAFSLHACNGKSNGIQAEGCSDANQIIDFWDSQHKGVNQFNKFPSENWFKAAAEANIGMVRLTYGKWESEHRDFLIGDADNYTGLVEKDFLKLKESLDWADAYGIKVVLTSLSLPGARWKQNNDNIEDGKIWKESKYLEHAKQFWIDLASRLDHHPTIVGYNLKNEPHPEIFYGYEDVNDPAFLLWYDSIQNTPADINYYNQELTNAIRSIDKTTPIVIESGLWGNAQTYNYLKPLDDPFVIYSFHVYDPYAFTTFRINKNIHPYPGVMPLSPWSDSIITLDKTWLEAYVQIVKEWTKKYDIPANRIFVSEFGCSRKIGGVENYLGDLIEIFNENKWHWAFYSYREDVWDSMDYELGEEKPRQGYWDHAGKASFHDNYELIYGKSENNKVWEVFKKELSVKRGE